MSYQGCFGSDCVMQVSNGHYDCLVFKPQKRLMCNMCCMASCLTNRMHAQHSVFSNTGAACSINIDELGVMLAVNLMRSLFLGITHVLGLHRIAPSTAHMGRACIMFCSQLAQGHLHGFMADA